MRKGSGDTYRDSCLPVSNIRRRIMSIEHEAIVERGWLSAGELLTYYEVQGTGDPLIILHGGFASVETFSEFSPLLSQHYRTYSPARRGHGRMPDPGGPIT